MGTRKGKLRAALARRDFRLLLAGYTTSATGDWLYSVSLIVYIFQVTGSAGWVAVTSLVRFAPYVALGTFGGVIADRFDRRRVMIVADLGRFCAMVALTIVAASDGPALAAAACAAVSVTFATAYSPAVRAVIPTLVGEDDLAAANTLISTVENVALALGPAIGGILLLIGTPAMAFGVNAATFLVSMACIARIRTSLEPAPGTDGEAPPRLRQRVAVGFGAIASSSAVLVLVVISVAFTVAYGQEIVLYTLTANELLGIGDDGLAFMWAAIGVGGILAAAITTRIAERRELVTVLALAALVSGVPMICLSFVRSVPLVYALLIVEGGAVIVADVIFVTLLQRSVAGEVLGRVFGILDSLMVAGILVGSLLAPAVVRVAGIEAALIAAGGLLLAVTALALPKASSIDRAAAERAAELDGLVRLLERLDLFGEASRPSLEAVAAAMVPEHVPAGTVVIREGDPADDLFIVAGGTLEVSAVGEGRTPARLSDMHEGAYFGEIGLLERMPRTATVTAATDCDLYRISGEDFLRAVSEAPRMSGRLVSVAAARLARTHPAADLGHA